jgi:hypothetical protein
MRTCEANDTCINKVFGTDKNTGIGYCKSHQNLRTDLKPKSKSFGIAKRSPRKPSRSIPSFGFGSQPDFFAWIWGNLSEDHKHVICQYTGEDITAFLYPAHPELWLNCFAHILPKKNYPYFRLNPANIRVVYPEFHTIVDQGTSEDRKKHPSWRFDLWDAEVLQMKETYKQFKKKNLLP